MTDSDNLQQKLAEFLGKILDVSVDPDRPDALLIEDYEADSMDLVDLVIRLEAQFGIRVADEEIPNLKSFGDIYQYIVTRQPTSSK